MVPPGLLSRRLEVSDFIDLAEATEEDLTDEPVVMVTTSSVAAAGESDR